MAAENINPLNEEHASNVFAILCTPSKSEVQPSVDNSLSALPTAHPAMITHSHLSPTRKYAILTPPSRYDRL
jgi:hypothetical protein